MMDPDATLAELRAIFRQEEDAPTLSREDLEATLARAADLFDGLDQWLATGGFLPEAWRPANEVITG